MQVKNSVSSSNRKPRARTQQVNVYVTYVGDDDRAQDKKQPSAERRTPARTKRTRAGA
jgi:hypothetical protein